MVDNTRTKMVTRIISCSDPDVHTVPTFDIEFFQTEEEDALSSEEVRGIGHKRKFTYDVSGSDNDDDELVKENVQYYVKKLSSESPHMCCYSNNNIIANLKEKLSVAQFQIFSKTCFEVYMHMHDCSVQAQLIWCFMSLKLEDSSKDALNSRLLNWETTDRHAHFEAFIEAILADVDNPILEENSHQIHTSDEQVIKDDGVATLGPEIESQYEIPDELLPSLNLMKSIIIHPTRCIKDDTTPVPMQRNRKLSRWNLSPFTTKFGSSSSTSASALYDSTILNKNYPFTPFIGCPYDLSIENKYLKWIKEGLVTTHERKKDNEDRFRKHKLNMLVPLQFGVELGCLGEYVRVKYDFEGSVHVIVDKTMDEYIVVLCSKDTKNEEWNILNFEERNLIASEYVDLVYRLGVEDDSISIRILRSQPNLHDRGILGCTTNRYRNKPPRSWHLRPAGSIAITTLGSRLRCTRYSSGFEIFKSLPSPRNSIYANELCNHTNVLNSMTQSKILSEVVFKNIEPTEMELAKLEIPQKDVTEDERSVNSDNDFQDPLLKKINEHSKKKQKVDSSTPVVVKKPSGKNQVNIVDEHIQTRIPPPRAAKAVVMKTPVFKPILTRQASSLKTKKGKKTVRIIFPLVQSKADSHVEEVVVSKRESHVEKEAFISKKVFDVFREEVCQEFKGVREEFTRIRQLGKKKFKKWSKQLNIASLQSQMSCYQVLMHTEEKASRDIHWQGDEHFNDKKSESVVQDHCQSSEGHIRIFSQKHSFVYHPIDGIVDTKIVNKFMDWISEDLLKVHAKRKRNADHYKREKSTIPMMHFGIETVEDKIWFYTMGFPDQSWTDSHIDVCFYYLRKKSKYDPNRSYKFRTIDCNFMNIIRFVHDVYSADVANLTAGGQVAHLNEYINGFRMHVVVPWHTVEDIYIPVNIKKKHHWVLAILSFSERCIFLYDSYESSGHYSVVLDVIEKLAAIIPLYLQHCDFYVKNGIDVENHPRYKDKDSSDMFDVLFQESFPQQSSEILNCGVYMVIYAECLFYGHKVLANEFDPNALHTRYAALLWEYGTRKQDANDHSDVEEPLRPAR
ncbi:hypothetical protein CQW23_14207 [Capsicum baccatum]|uniref:Ubiquitin-like protease family profile domain-containing protein n=1 Tax=Capsicum baccatum TaxID=33114 RepID=A0A2G2WIQ5_CAPBA|nr:hypothetical protein CQW23_14207 [Capsicum baccatum]